MKKLIFLTFLFSFFAQGKGQELSSETSAKLFPQGLSCQALMCVYGDEAFCQTDTYQQIFLRRLDVARPLWEGIGPGVAEFHEGDKVKIFFTLRDNDQFSSFTFLSEDMARLKAGKVAKIKGIYEDHYDWDQGLNTHALLVMQCQALPLVIF